MVALLLVLFLVGCSTDGATNQSASGDRPAVVIETVGPAGGRPTPMPTAVVPAATFTPTPPAPLAALVNGRYVFLSDYERRLAQYEQALLLQGIEPDTTEGQEYLVEARQEILEGLIDSALITQGALGLGITVTEQELESQVETDIATGGGQAAFDEWLSSTGQSREDYKEMLRQAMLAQRVMEAVTTSVGTEAEQVHARYIVVDSEEKAQQILAMLQQGADFAALAREHSLDSATKENGGDLGWFPRGLVMPELESAAFALQSGQVSGVVRLGDEFHIIQVVEREAAHALSPEMQLDLKQAVFEEWLAGLKAEAVIERFVGE